VQTYSFFHAHLYFVGPVLGSADAACGMSCATPTTAKHNSDKRHGRDTDLRDTGVGVSSGVVMSITDSGKVDSRIAVMNNLH